MNSLFLKQANTFSSALSALLLLSSVSFTACKRSSNEETAKPAQVSAPMPLSVRETAKDTVYSFSNADSKLGFVGAKITGKHEGSFQVFSGKIGIPEGDLTKATVRVEVEISSIKTDSDKLTGHLLSEDFFAKDKFPKASFTSVSISQGGANGASHTISGNLELHGVTKGISFPAKLSVEGEMVNAEAEFVINRKDFGIAYPGKPDDLIKDDVAIKLSLHAKKGS